MILHQDHTEINSQCALGGSAASSAGCDVAPRPDPSTDTATPDSDVGDAVGSDDAECVAKSNATTRGAATADARSNTTTDDAIQGVA